LVEVILFLQKLINHHLVPFTGYSSKVEKTKVTPNESNESKEISNPSPASVTEEQGGSNI
jgi:hypothetical protein